MTTVVGRIPRPYGKTLKATKPNELLHFDFLTMIEDDGNAKYVLVLNDKLSGYVELIACSHAGADQAYHGLMDWFKRLGIVLPLGYYSARRVVGVEHNAGGPARRQEAPQSVRGSTRWRTGPQHPSSTRAYGHNHRVGCNATYRMFGWRSMLCTSSWSTQARGVTAPPESATAGARVFACKSSARVISWLAATATGRRGNKLALVWRGPKRIVRALNDYTFEVHEITSRLQLYRDATRGRFDELQEQTIYGEGGHLVEALDQRCLSPATHHWEIKVKWFVLDEIEASREPAEMMNEDVHALFDAFVIAQPTDKGRIAMAQALQTPTPVPSVRPPHSPAHITGAPRRVVCVYRELCREAEVIRQDKSAGLICGKPSGGAQGDQQLNTSPWVPVLQPCLVLQLVL
ncbi:unnamed protein product [Phytophthora fragariaefolia]|uniref:Unnamed protein product n=1 Tax=Phytophthora fragariaefolia TaxID=1490495 RepID=A0A9W6XSQ7_9STRA|nr:unnamed protein product [Phytophthora fragariaefolia]